MKIMKLTFKKHFAISLLFVTICLINGCETPPAPPIADF